MEVENQENLIHTRPAEKSIFNIHLLESLNRSLACTQTHYEPAEERQRKASASFIPEEASSLESSDKQISVIMKPDYESSIDERVDRNVYLVKSSSYKYIGEMKSDKRDGFGICYFSRGEVYTGQWREDLFEGLGYFTLPNGEIHRGELKENHFEGFCEVVDMKNNLKISGNASKGKFCDEVTVEEDNVIYDGINVNNLCDSKIIAKVTFSPDHIFYGEISLSPCGNISEELIGIVYKKDNPIYFGELTSSLSLNGYGEIYSKDKFFGFFKNNIKQGLSLQINPECQKMAFGAYSEGIKVGPFFYTSVSAPANVKMELYYSGFKCRTVEKFETVKKYLELNYPEFKSILQFNYKDILNSLIELKDEDLASELKLCKESTPNEEESKKD